MKKDNIARILQLQDSIEKKYLREDKIIIERFSFSVNCLNWTFDSLSVESNNLNIVRPIFADSLSSILASINVGLWGLNVDSLHLLRPVLELLAIADYIIENNKFDEYKLSKKSLNKNKLDFDYLRSKKMVDKDLEKIYNKICNHASHATLQRIKNNKFEMDGRIYNKVGCAYNPKEIQLLFEEISRISLYLTRVILPFLEKESILYSEQKKLESAFKKLP